METALTAELAKINIGVQSNDADKGGRVMSSSSPTTMKMPEVTVFARAMLLGAALFEMLWVALLAGEPFGRWLLANNGIGIVIIACTFAIFIIGAYARKRGAWAHAKRVYESRRLDLLSFALLGAVVMRMLAPQLSKFHKAVATVDVCAGPIAYLVLLLMLISPMWRELIRRKRSDATQTFFMADTEIKELNQDVLDVAGQAANFADTVLSSGAQAGLVFGLDGPWGVGKTSFLNLAKKRWEDVGGNAAIVFTFEPLRYASEPDLSERFIKDLCVAIRQKVFAPEFLPAATRYSRMLKGKTDFSILGIKLSLEPSNETIDEMLDDIDELLKQVDRRLIVVIDDLDRLDSKLVNNVLFTVRRTFKLSQASYILCYDTETLVAAAGGKDDGVRAREFLEKFITAKKSLFVDLKAIDKFLSTDWEDQAIKSDTALPKVMIQLRQIMNAVRAMLTGDQAHHYVPLLGDMRKIKRFVNAVLLLNLEKVKLDGTDFVAKDLIHLMLLHLFYPGLFRRLYAQETEGRKGSFSVQKGGDNGEDGLTNGAGLAKALTDANEPAEFLLNQLFDVKTLDLKLRYSNDETALHTRACFNWPKHRNLENYLQLIVRLKLPAPTSSFRLYSDVLEDVKAHRKTVADVLQRPDFALTISEAPQDQFWTRLVGRAYELDRKAANDAIDTLITWLPKYSSVQPGGYSMRERAVASLQLLLDRAGFGELPGNGRLRNLSDLAELAARILEDHPSSPTPSLVRQLTASDRGALGWKDLLWLRLRCSADRLSDAHNIYTALARWDDEDARVQDDVGLIAQSSLRRLSQKVFEEFRQRYIDAGVNFFIDVDRCKEGQVLGEGGRALVSDVGDVEAAIQRVLSGVKTFVVYQLTSDKRGDGSGVPCGSYDETGTLDHGGIRRAMTEYLFGFCFDPVRGVLHAQAFADFCLRSLRDQPFDIVDAGNVEGTMQAVTRLLGDEPMVNFWVRSGKQVKELLSSMKHTVHCFPDQKFTYEARLPTVFAALDRLVASANTQSPPAGERHGTMQS